MNNPHSVLVYLRPTRLIYVRETGPYTDIIPKAWAKLFAWLNDNGLYASLGRGYGLARDNPLEVGLENCRYDACVEVRPELEDKALRELGVATLPGGAYACRRLTGSYDRMRSLVANVYSEFAPPAGLCFDENRPVVSIYVDNPNRYRDVDLRSDICVPIVAADEVVYPKFAESA
ncbi:GyrI-like domain-containing protein [Hyphomicrobium sp.]|jgi:AraC family transcriptional regulator|uniref:AraC family transcriptional regulator n=1 Tax=Hyphomicrobium sp. TaxID=82 RepID=UPI002CE1B2A7|nr:GyrI-like domain-containing protein [Hyphomicrobium sp.]HVZ06150.1 GyrI-like domain-containing protein [Hyphomicrobium sp.]